MNETKDKNLELSHSMVHYLLTIHNLKESKGYARVTDIAKELKLTKGSVSTAINNLKKKSLVTEEDDSKFLLLTQEGHGEVHKILSSRILLYHFLKDFLGVSDDVAAGDACGMEHLMSSETRDKFFSFMKLAICPGDCGDKERIDGKVLGPFKSTLKLCDFDNTESFIESQAAELNLISRK